jgi:hypothetical protein
MLFNATLSARIALIAYAAYCSDKVVPWTCFWCQRTPAFGIIGTFGNSSGAAFGFVGVDRTDSNGGIVVMWRGTDSISGWVADAEFSQIANPWGQGNVHKGFVASYSAARAGMVALLHKALAICPSCNVTISGHSLGAALAVLTVADLGAQINGRGVRALTFGGPRVGDAAFVSWMTSARSSVAMERHTWEADLVPRLPPQSLLLVHYAHMPTEICHHSKWKVCSTTDGEDSSCILSVPFFLLNWIDHGSYFGVSIFAGIPAGCLFDTH